MINQKKFAKIKSSSDPMTSSMTSKSYVSPSAATTTASVAASAKKAAATSTSTKKTETPPATPVKLDTVLVTFKDDQTTAAGSKGLRQQFSRKLTVKDALQQLLGVDSKVNVEHDTKKGLLEIKFPLPKREVEVDMLSSSLDKLLGASSSITFGRKKRFALFICSNAVFNDYFLLCFQWKRIKESLRKQQWKQKEERSIQTYHHRKS